MENCKGFYQLLGCDGSTRLVVGSYNLAKSNLPQESNAAWKLYKPKELLSDISMIFVGITRF